MVSARSLRPLLWTVRLGSFLWIFPPLLLWDTKLVWKDREKSGVVRLLFRPRRLSHKLLLLSSITFISINMIYILKFMSSSNSSILDLTLGFNMLFSFFLGISVQLNFLFRFQDFVHTLNTLLLLDERFRENIDIHQSIGLLSDYLVNHPYRHNIGIYRAACMPACILEQSHFLYLTLDD